MTTKILKPDEMPLIVLSPKSMIFPKTMVRIFLEKYPDFINRSKDTEYTPFVFLSMERLRETDEKTSIYTTGVVASIASIGRNKPMLGLKGEYRAKIKNLTQAEQNSSYLTASIEYTVTDIPEKFFREIKGKLVVAPEHSNNVRALLNLMRDEIGTLLEIGEGSSSMEGTLLNSIDEEFDSLDTSLRDVIDEIVWQTAFNLPDINAREKQRLIESLSLIDRMVKCTDLLTKNIEIISAEKRLKVQSSANRRKRLTAGSNDTSINGQEIQPSADAWFVSKDPSLQNKYKLFCEVRDSIKDVRERETFIETAKRDFLELQTFERSKGDGTQTAMTNDSLDFVLALPWGKKSDETIDFNEFESIFEGDHYGLDRVKDKVTDFIAVKRGNPDGKSRVLLFLGPPGVGKTSVCKSIAEGLKRKYVRISLGGMKDESEIRGHRRVYIKALPGRILSELKKAGTKNPVFVLDEIDKVGKDSFHGDPSDALLEVLDPEQNWSFKDSYLDAPFDLSQVLFICTANNLSGIPPALFDRMEPVHFSGYTEDAKIQIAKKFLIPKSLIDVGLNTKENFELRWENNDQDDVLLRLIRGYTREAGVRSIERIISNILYRIVKKEQRNPGYIKEAVIDEKLIAEVHGIPRYTKTRANETKIGEVIGLAWTETGGEILYVQSAIIPKQGETILSQTGQLGSVMREADKLALSLQRLRLEELDKTELIENKLIHLHIPQGAIPKDGPSAGITACFSLESAILKKVARQRMAMTGEITLSGMVTAVGGIKEKVIAAANAGIEVLILPKSNEKDYLEEVPEFAKSKFKSVNFVETIEQARSIVFPK